MQEMRRTLHAALELERFTLDELAAHAGVAAATVRTIRSRNPDLFVERGRRQTERGGPPMEYEVDREAVQAYLGDDRPNGVTAARLQLVFKHLLWDLPLVEERRAREMIETARLGLRKLDLESRHARVIAQLIDFAELEERDVVSIRDAKDSCTRLEDEAEKLLLVHEAQLAAAIYRRVSRSVLRSLIDRAAERPFDVFDPDAVDRPVQDAHRVRERAMAHHLFEARG